MSEVFLITFKSDEGVFKPNRDLNVSYTGIQAAVYEMETHEILDKTQVQDDKFNTQNHVHCVLG